MKSSEFTSLFDNLKKQTYYYFLEDKKMSYLLADGFNMIKGQLQQIKNIRKDSGFKLSILTYARRALYYFLLSIEFLAKDKQSTLELWVFPYLINSFNEIEVKFDGLIKFMLENYKLNNKYLHQFFSRDYFRSWFVKIRDIFIETFKFRLASEISTYFANLDKIDNFIVTDFFDQYIKTQIEISSVFASNLSAIPEQCLLDGLFNDLFEFISRSYKDWTDFEFEKIKGKLSEVQGKILTLKLTDSLLKTKLVKITKSFEEFFTSEENAQINAFNISFAFSFRKNYEKVVSIIRFKEFQDPERRLAVLKFIYTATTDFKNFEDKKDNMNLIFYKMRILKNLSKFVTKIVDVYHQKFGDPNAKVDDEEDAPEKKDEDAPAEEMQKPPELDEVYLPCRYFPYKKKEKQNFAYIKNKYANQDQSASI